MKNLVLHFQDFLISYIILSKFLEKKQQNILIISIVYKWLKEIQNILKIIPFTDNSNKNIW